MTAVVLILLAFFGLPALRRLSSYISSQWLLILRSRDDLRKWANTPGPAAGESEDCVNLNVFAPATLGEGHKAVIVWIYSGGYDGSSLAANQDVVVVTINYRTNVFGFANSLNLLKAERNLGLLDQRLALDWVQRNIAAFGESAGAMSVDALVANPPVPLSFRAAILQSASWSMLLSVTNCSPSRNLECLRAIPAAKLKGIIERSMLTFTPISDGITWPLNTRRARLNSTEKHSQIARVPVMVGSNGGEGWTFVGELNQTAPLSIASVGISAWRCVYNASFLSTQLYLEPVAYHAAVPSAGLFSTGRKVVGEGVFEGLSMTVDSTASDARCHLYQNLYYLRK
ncbi:Alpha/Beta hydrolase protein [Aspergillus arachidicola]|uniref:Alpha/Beta hydrolase protein n=1 Tax=Aspergillus arachidicola TaxID=656916 RepID=A0A5N6XM51_9EURO|nr:Alpha/Beta hydrolase protein [Aspergillus arachidicola]